MAVSNSVDFALTATEVIEEARAKLGIHADEEPLSSTELTRGLRALNVMLKGWQARPWAATWLATEGTLTLVESQASYTFQSGGDFTTVPFDITDMRITRNSTDLQMTELSREDYYALPNKTNEGYPTNWYYDRQRDSGTLYVWPVPDSTAGTLKFTYQRVIMDLDAGIDNFDFPQEWYEAVIYNLARRFIPNYSNITADIAQFVVMEAEALLRTLESGDTGMGAGSVSILPAGMD